MESSFTPDSKLSFSLRMADVQRPGRAITRQSRQIYIPDYQDETTERVVVNRQRSSQSMLPRLLQLPDSFKGIVENPATFTIRIPWPQYQPSLPFHHDSSSVQPIPLRRMTPAITHRGGEDLGTSCNGSLSRRSVAKQKTLNQPTQEQCNSKPARNSRRNIGVKSPTRTKHEERKKEVLDVLTPILAGEGMNTASILLCYDRGHHCQIFPVKVPHSADKVAVWQQIRREWYEKRGSWRKMIPFFGVKEVSVVDVSS